MLTAKQQKTYQFIYQYIQKYDYAPTAAEIAAGIGIKSRGVVHRYVKALAAAGMIDIVPGRRRNICLRQTPEEIAAVLPVVGKIAAGQPLEAIVQQQSFNISHYLSGANRFILEVKGDSMTGDNICDGDYIICESCVQADKNDIVIALIDGEEATLKRIQYNDDGTITLLPSNAQFSSMVYAAERVQVQGTYIGLLRLTSVREK